MSSSYHNTTGLEGNALHERIEQADSQEERVQTFFEHRPGAHLTPFEVQKKILPGVPITSVRRALTNLTERGVLEKTDQMREGRFGQPNHTWTLAAEVGEQRVLFPPVE